MSLSEVRAGKLKQPTHVRDALFLHDDHDVSAGVAGLGLGAAGQLWRLWLPECRLSTAP